MNLSRAEIVKHFSEWLIAWNDHNLDGVMEFMHEEIVFENWNGAIITGKKALKKIWALWFMHHGNFKFTEEAIFLDEEEQKMTFQWRLEWPSTEKKFRGKHEIRRGVDILHFLDGKIYKKVSYSKTTIQIDSTLIEMHAV
ncbi:MAG TPA: nuclear transport factor 2 family protein [Chitinophagaceae bacterium]|nr:nuclear transport factor 2 family protein [Chitinophagaceae bacterium]